MLQALKDRIAAKPKLTREQMLAVRPLRHGKIEWAREERKSDSVLVVLLKIPRMRGKWADFVAKWLRVPDFKKVELDEIGSDVWEKCDGNHSVDALAKAIGATYRLNKRQAEVSVTAYLKMLAERRFVALKAAAGTAKTNHKEQRTQSPEQKFGKQLKNLCVLCGETTENYERSN